MNSFTMLTEERSVEMIWFLESRVRQLSEENDSVWESYEELSRQHFG